MSISVRCLYNNTFDGFCSESDSSVLGILCNKYHGDALTTTRDAWMDEKAIMKKILSPFRNGKRH